MSDKSETASIGVGMPQWLYLNQFGRMVYEAFGVWPFLVGSASVGKQWRDVDVRLILFDEDYARIVGILTKPEALNQRWNVLCMAFSELGKRVTGLPIDFQIQQMTQANTEFPHQHRHALIMMAERELTL